MPNLELTTEQVIELVRQLSPEGKRAVLSVLETELDTESKVWLEANLTQDLPPYDWGAEGVPEGKPIHYIPGLGLVIKEK